MAELATVALLAAVLLAQLISLVLGIRARRAPAVDSYVGQRVQIHLKTERSLRGVLASVAHDTIVLRGAEYLGESGTAHPADGECVIERRNLSWFQALGGAEDPAS